LYLQAVLYDAARIAVGEKVFGVECHVCFSVEGKLALSWEAKGRETKLHDIIFDEVQQLKFFVTDLEDSVEEGKVDDDEDESGQMSFLSLNVKKTEANGLKSYKNKYKPNDADGPFSAKKFIVVEFQSVKDFRHLLEEINKDPDWSSLLADAQIEKADTSLYAKSLLEDSKMDRRRRGLAITSLQSKERTGFLQGKKEDDILLKYPFDGDKQLMERAAHGLTELNGLLSLEDETADGTNETQSIATAAAAKGEDEDEEPNKKKSARTHNLTIKVGDFERLEPTEYLNDTLVDFWIRW
jgi:Ulp1 family protease